MNEKAKENLDDTLKKLEDGVKNVFESQKYKNVLDTMSKFHNYSLNNIFLINSQNPNASYVAGFNKWKELGRTVKRGEHGLKILAPIPRKVEVEVLRKDETGKMVREKEEKQYMSYKVVYVYDISQTEGKDIDLSLIRILNGENENYEKLLTILKGTTQCEVVEDETGKSNGYYSREKNKIVIKSSSPIEQKIKTLIHEIAHSKLHSTEESILMDRRQQEIEAESVAYVVCNYLKIDSSEYSFGYIAAWSKDQECEYLKSVLEKIKNVAKNIIDDIDTKALELSKDKKEKQIGSLAELINESHTISFSNEKKHKKNEICL